MPKNISSLVDRLCGIATRLIEEGETPNPFRTSDVAFHQHPEVEREIESIAQALVSLNPNMLSVRETSHFLRWPLLTDIIDGRLPIEDGVKITRDAYASAELSRLANFIYWETIEAPVLHFALEDGGFTFGEVEFTKFDPYAYRDDSMLGWHVTRFNGRMSSLAAVRCPGDSERRLVYFNERVATALRIILGALWPQVFSRVDTEALWPPSVVGTGLDPGATPYRTQGQPAFTISRGAAHGLGGGFLIPKHLRELWGEEGLEQLVGIAGASNPTSMENGLLTGLGWLGEAMKPGTVGARMVMIATAVESFVGPADTHDPYLTGRGITATLAERAAFVGGSSPQERETIDKQVRELYRERSEALHARSTLNSGRLDEFGCLAWRIGRATASHLPEWKTVADLARWTRSQRYA